MHRRQQPYRLIVCFILCLAGLPEKRLVKRHMVSAVYNMLSSFYMWHQFRTLVTENRSQMEDSRGNIERILVCCLQCPTYFPYMSLYNVQYDHSNDSSRSLPQSLRNGLIRALVDLLQDPHLLGLPPQLLPRLGPGRAALGLQEKC